MVNHIHNPETESTLCREYNGEYALEVSTWEWPNEGWADYRESAVSCPDCLMDAADLWAPPGAITAHDPVETRMTSATGGQKGAKLARYDLLPAEALREVAELYGIGAGKYEDRNWERGYDWSLSFAALNRHLWQFWAGEDLDAETGKAHMASVVFHALALLQYMEQHRAYDDRPTSSDAPSDDE